MVIRIRRQSWASLYLSWQISCLAGLNQVLSLPLSEAQDELLAAFSLLGIAWALLAKRLTPQQTTLLWKSSLALGLLVCLGLASNELSQLIAGAPIAIDAFKIVKLPLVLFYVTCVLRDWEKRSVIANLQVFSRGFILLAFLGGVVNLVMECGLSYDVRYGIRSYKFLYENPAALNEVLLVSLVLIMLSPKRGKLKLWLGLYLATVVMTLRANGLGVSGILLVALGIKQRGWRLKAKEVAVAGLLALGLGWPQLKEYFFSETVRSKLLRHSFIVFKDYFPFGSGFATYGSDQAFKHYSPLYTRFGFHHDYALASETGFAMNDNFWPMILAQFGLLGCLCYFYWLCKQFAACWRLTAGVAQAACLSLQAFLVISSLGNPIFTSASGVMLASVLGLSCQKGVDNAN